MKITIISMGKFENSPFRAVFETYVKRIKWKIELRELELKNAQNLSSQELKSREAALILKDLKSQSKLIVLDENGKEYKSREFAKMLANFAVQGDSNITFVIGGSDGLAEEILQKSVIKISLGLMTFPHLMVRAILIEQIYRAQTIIEGHPYHRD
jgi:23S rRNA (pseudouridine1915-N3)-methyltransferase